MRDSLDLGSFAAIAATAVFFCALILISPQSVLAADPADPSPAPRPAMAMPALDATDEIATLEAIRLALTEVGDGATYVWHRAHGRLSGTIQPTTSFRDKSGQICRHLIINLATTNKVRSAEGIACRTTDGTWELTG